MMSRRKTKIPAPTSGPKKARIPPMTDISTAAPDVFQGSISGTAKVGEEETEHEIEEVHFRLDVETQKHRPLEPGEPVQAAGQRVPLRGDEVEHLAEGDREHGEVDPALADD